MRFDLVGTAQRQEAAADRLGKVRLRVRLLDPESFLEDLAQLGFHRPAAPRGAHANSPEETGTTRWYLYDLDRDAILEEPAEILDSIRSKPETPRKCVMEQKSLIDLRSRVQRHITNTYLKRIDAPVGVKPSLKYWMELNEG